MAGLIDDPNTPLVGKMKGKSYPTEEHGGIVYAWMGETEPVPLEEDLPPEILDDRNHWYNRVKLWDANWTEPVNQGIDYHEAYLLAENAIIWEVGPNRGGSSSTIYSARKLPPSGLG